MFGRRGTRRERRIDHRVVISRVAVGGEDGRANVRPVLAEAPDLPDRPVEDDRAVVLIARLKHDAGKFLPDLAARGFGQVVNIDFGAVRGFDVALRRLEDDPQIPELKAVAPLADEKGALPEPLAAGFLLFLV